MGYKPDCTTSKNSMMPVYPTRVSAYPNHLARSALFSPIKKGARKWWKSEKIASREDVSIFFTGQQLDMADCDVFLQAIKIAQGRPVGERIYFERAAFLRSIGRPTGTTAYIWLDKSLERLKMANLKIESKKFKLVASLLDSYALDKDTGDFFLRFNLEILPLFKKEYAYIDMQKRITLKKDFTKWMQGYVASHEKGLHKVAVDKLYQWSGSKTLLKKWKTEKLKPALAELENMKIIKKVEVGHLAKWEKL